MTLYPAELTRIRTDYTATLGDTGKVVRLSGDPTFNPTTGAYTNPTETTIYTGPGRATPRPATETIVTVGEQPITLRLYDVSLPYDADGIQVDDYWIATVSVDAELVGRRLRVLEVGWSSLQAGRRLLCQDVLG